MEEISKKVNLLYIIQGDSILVRKSIHQDYEVIDVFPFKDDVDIEASINNTLSALFGKTFPYHYYGDIDRFIISC
jgi:hypothetical protein